jgi:hypothetical protein
MQRQRSQFANKRTGNGPQGIEQRSHRAVSTPRPVTGLG